MALGAVMALVGGLNEEDDGQQRLSLEESAVGLGKMQEQLKEDSSRLKSVVSLFDKVKQEQSELKVKEDDLKNKETSIRSAVHEARNSVVALKYKIHNMKTEAFSNQMFSDSEQRRKDAEQRLVLKKLALEGQEAHQAHPTGAETPAQAVAPLPAAPAPAAPTPAIPTPAAAPAPQVALHPAAPPVQQQAKAPAPRVEEVRAQQPHPTYVRSVVYEKPIAPPANQQQEMRPVVRSTMVEQRRPSTWQMASSAQQRANFAQQQAYHRSAEYLAEQEAEQRQKYAMGLMPMPQLPALHPLGPEAAGP